MPDEKVKQAFEAIQGEMKEQVRAFEADGKLLEAQRIRMRTMYDLEMMREMGYCPGIENYSRHLSGRATGEPPYTLLHYFSGQFLTVIDESHATIPQLKAMYRGDQSRKGTLVEHGFRLPSAKDNRPLSFDEFMNSIGQTVFCTATPGPLERELSSPPVLQSIRPTGIIDPPVIIRPLGTQIDDLMEEVRAHAERNERVLVTTLTKRTAEDLAEYLTSSGLRVQYLHSNVEALERVEILRALRKCDFDCLVGINLLREGLDLPEVALVAILDADKEGFLRSETSLLQTAGRAARNVTGKVILYADQVTKSMQRMMDVTEKRREAQAEYNERHGVTPRTIVKAIGDSMSRPEDPEEINRGMVREDGVDYDVREVLNELKQEMVSAAERLEFERAAMLRDQIRELERDEGE
jgi:excinuclease ABC subunit B